MTDGAKLTISDDGRELIHPDWRISAEDIIFAYKSILWGTRGADNAVCKKKLISIRCENAHHVCEYNDADYEIAQLFCSKARRLRDSK